MTISNSDVDPPSTSIEPAPRHYLSGQSTPFRDAAHAVDVFRRLGWNAGIRLDEPNLFGKLDPVVDLGPCEWSGASLDEALRGCFGMVLELYRDVASEACALVVADGIAGSVPAFMSEAETPFTRFRRRF